MNPTSHPPVRSRQGRSPLHLVLLQAVFLTSALLLGACQTDSQGTQNVPPGTDLLAAMEAADLRIAWRPEVTQDGYGPLRQFLLDGSRTADDVFKKDISGWLAANPQYVKPTTNKNAQPGTNANVAQNVVNQSGQNVGNAPAPTPTPAPPANNGGNKNGGGVTFVAPVVTPEPTPTPTPTPTSVPATTPVVTTTVPTATTTPTPTTPAPTPVTEQGFASTVDVKENELYHFAFAHNDGETGGVINVTSALPTLNAGNVTLGGAPIVVSVTPGPHTASVKFVSGSAGKPTQIDGKLDVLPLSPAANVKSGGSQTFRVIQGGAGVTLNVTGTP